MNESSEKLLEVLKSLEKRVAELELFVRVTQASGLDKLVLALANQSVLTDDEATLQAKVRERLSWFAIPFEEQFILSKESRADFIAYVNIPSERVKEGYGSATTLEPILLELKVQGGRSDLLRQLDRYAQMHLVRGVLVVTTKRQLAILPEVLQGKPVRAVWMGGV